MTDDKKDGASIAGFFDDFNKDADKQAIMEEVHRRLCEVLTELAEDIVDALSQTGAAAGVEGDSDATAAEGEEAGLEPKGPASSSATGVDEVAAMSAYNDALAAIMREEEVNSKDMCTLPDEHPLKELFFSAFDQQMFRELLDRFLAQVRDRKQGPGEWDAEAAEGECDEDHTLE